jgi:hypothetical protein
LRLNSVPALIVGAVVVASVEVFSFFFFWLGYLGGGRKNARQNISDLIALAGVVVGTALIKQ